MRAQGRLQFAVRRTTDSAELRAAADLRAASFYEYPVDRSSFSAQVLDAVRVCTDPLLISTD